MIDLNMGGAARRGCGIQDSGVKLKKFPHLALGSILRGHMDSMLMGRCCSLM
jgi:hypothetical protein